jgi:hypothetical protein
MYQNLMRFEASINAEGIKIKTSTLAAFTDVIPRFPRNAENVGRTGSDFKCRCAHGIFLGYVTLIPGRGFLAFTLHYNTPRTTE